MHASERDVVDGRDRDCIRDFVNGEAEKPTRTRSRGDRKLNGMVESLRHYGNAGCESALDFIGCRECQHEFLARCPYVIGRCKDGPEVITRMAKATLCHVGVKKVHIAYQRRVEESRLIGRGLAAADHRATTWGSIFLDLFAYHFERSTRDSSDSAPYAVQNIPLEKLPILDRQVL